MDQKRISNLYKIGQDAKSQGIDTMRQLDRVKHLDGYSHTEMVIIEAGLRGAEMPREVTGWRYGHVPRCGQSYNARDGFLESGVSVMAVDGGEETQDQISAVFIAPGRPVIRVRGLLNTIRRGSDGEPLVMDAEEI